MHNIRSHFSFSPLALSVGVVAVLIVTYAGLIAVVMNYAALAIEFSQSARNEEAAVAALEGRYLAVIARITTTDYLAAGYVLPRTKTFVQMKSATALR